MTTHEKALDLGARLASRATFQSAMRKADKNAFCEQTDIDLLHEAASLIQSQAARIAELEAGLEFYGDVSKYPAPFTGGMGALWADCGQTARALLNGERKG